MANRMLQQMDLGTPISSLEAGSGSNQADGELMKQILAEMDRLRKENKHLARAVSTLTVDKAILTDAIEILKKKSQQRALLKQQIKS
jgi:hypothetical protein